MIVENLANAFVVLTSGTTKVVVDPWITDGIYDGTWCIEPPLKTHKEALTSAAACIITHIHADHFDINALNLLSKHALIVIPDIYPNRQVVARKAPDLIERFVFQPVGTSLKLGDFDIEFIGPMNRYGHKLDKYDSLDELAAIDTGIIVSEGEHKAVLLADNFPYHLASTGASLERMKDSSVLMFPYNACADDYPTCHDNMSLPEKQAKALSRNIARVDCLRLAFNELKPRLIVPYSSDFMIAGARAEEFVAVHPRQFLDKKEASCLYQQELGITCRALFEGDQLKLTSTGYALTIHNVDRPSFEHLAKKLSKRPINVSNEEIDDATLWDQFQRAVTHMFEKMEKLKLSSLWSLELRSQTTGFVMGVELDTKAVYCNNVERLGPLTVRCSTTSSQLNSLLSFKTHWDNAMISYNLSWARSVDEYDVALHKALNYLHVPLRKP